MLETRLNSFPRGGLFPWGVFSGELIYVSAVVCACKRCDIMLCPCYLYQGWLFTRILPC